MYYFKQFPIILYSFDPAKFEYESVVNIFARVNVIPEILTNSLVYYEYQVKDSDTAPIIAFKYYGDALRHWMVYFANQVVDPYFDMPLSEDDLTNQIIYNFGTEANAQATLFNVTQYVNVTTVFQGTSNTISYVSTLQDPYSYNFRTRQLEAITLPTIQNPILQVSNTTVELADGTLVTTTTTLVAQDAYDYMTSANEQLRQIQLIDNQYASTLEQELTQLLSS